MKKITQVILLTLLCLAIAVPIAYSQTAHEDAKALLKKAVGYYKANGKEKALAEFSNPKGKFVKNDQYIYVLDMKGKMLAHPNAELVAQDSCKESYAQGMVKQGSGRFAYFKCVQKKSKPKDRIQDYLF